MQTLDVATALDILIPGGRYQGSLTENSQSAYMDITWDDDRHKPEWSEVETCMNCPYENAVWNGTVWVYDLELHQSVKCAEVGDMLREKYNEMFSYEGSEWQVDEISQSHIMARNAVAQASIANPVAFPWNSAGGIYLTWRNFANEDISMPTAEDFQSFAKSVSDHCNPLAAVYRAHKDSIRLLSTYDAVRDYDITEGW